MSLDAAMNDLDGDRRLESPPAGTCASAGGMKGSYGPRFAPPALLAFAQGQPARAAASALGLSVGTVHRLKQGYWPADSRWIMLAWEKYLARRSVVSSSWFLRRVRDGGLVRHAGAHYTSVQLSARTGQLLAVARNADGELIAQTLELPAERLSLRTVEEVAP